MEKYHLKLNFTISTNSNNNNLLQSCLEDLDYFVEDTTDKFEITDSEIIDYSINNKQINLTLMIYGNCENEDYVVDVVDELDCSFTSNTQGVYILESELVDFEYNSESEIYRYSEERY